ncbi:MAG: hypothetical protein KGD72_01720 [Candidatus Lokiarchaeota archaeon]|nr:hypothetical protein [Candidatus Lokiarchaeota archaeon]
MERRNNDKNQKETHELILFNEDTETKSKLFEPEPLEYIDQEDKINMVYKLVPFGGNYLYSLLITNQSTDPITKVKIRINFPGFFKLCRSTPPTLILESLESGGDGSNNNQKEIEQQQIVMKFESLEKNSNKQINLYLCPLFLEEKGTIRSFITFVNNADFIRAIDTDTIPIQFDPFSIEKKIIPSSEIKQFLEKPWIKKAIKSIGIGIDSQLDEKYYFEYINEVLETLNFQLIMNIQSKKISWFFGTDLVSGNDVLIICQLSGHKIEWLAASSNPHLLISLLTKIITVFEREMILRGHIESKEQIYTLECRYCGNTLTYFPPKGESIKCNKCNYEQIVWN